MLSRTHTNPSTPYTLNITKLTRTHTHTYTHIHTHTHTHTHKTHTRIHIHTPSISYSLSHFHTPYSIVHIQLLNSLKDPSHIQVSPITCRSLNISLYVSLSLSLYPIYLSFSLYFYFLPIGISFFFFLTFLS